MLRDYELVLIVRPDVPEEDVKGMLEKMSQMVTGQGGSVDAVETWGKKRFSFPLDKYREGNYVLLTCKLEPKFTGELEASLKFTEEVLRHLLVRV